MTFLRQHHKALKAEFLKMKRSGILWLCLGAALFIPLLLTLVNLFAEVIPVGESGWMNGFIEMCLRGFTGFFFPLFIILIVVRLVYMEHKADTWKLLETQPVHRLALFNAKWLAAAMISMLCLLALLFFTLCGALLLQLGLRGPTEGLGDVSWGKTVGVIIRFWISSLALISLQFFLSLLIRSFAWPTSIGLAGIIAGSSLVGFGIWSWWPYSTITLTSQAYDGSITGNFLMPHEKLSVFWAALFYLLAYQYYLRRSLKRTILLPSFRIIPSIALLVAGIFAAYYFSRPQTAGRHHRTVIAGKVESKEKVDNLVLLRAPLYDTLALIPVHDGKFHEVLNIPVQAGPYYIRGGGFRNIIFMGENDSIHLKITFADKKYELKVTGTRIAENEFMRSNRQRDDFRELSSLAYLFTPEEFLRQVRKSWRNAEKKIVDFKTVDMIRPADDFIRIQKQIAAMQLLNLVDNHYPSVFAIHHPNEQMQYPETIEKIRKEFVFTDSSLALFPEFLTVASQKLLNQSGRNDSLFRDIAEKELPNAYVRDAVYYYTIDNEVFRIRDSVRRNLMLFSGLQMIRDDNMKQHLLARAARIQRMQRGKKAPDFAAAGMNNRQFSLGMFHDRYIVIDVWATWCAPCKKEAPYFEEHAEAFTGKDLIFVSLSVDEDRDAWQYAVSGKKTKVLQLWAEAAEEEILKAYDIEAIPRFMLIGPNGNILHSELPPPSDPEFQEILNREIPSLSNRSF